VLDDDLELGRIAVAAVLALALVVTAAATAFALLHAWQLPAGGERGSAALVDAIPQPRLQSAPQLQRPTGTASALPKLAAAATPEIEQRLGAALPAALRLFDSAGRPIDAAALSAPGRVLVLLPAWYRCDTLCGTVAHGALEALADTGLPPAAWQLVLFSIDPHDTPADARALQAVYAGYAGWARPAVYRQEAPALQLLTGDAAQTARLARAVGWRWTGPARSDDALGRSQFDHATGLVVLTPQGVVSSYLLGVRYDPATLRRAIVAASDGRVGTFTERLLLACAHFDPRWGGHDAAVIALLRGVGVAMCLGLGVWVWRHRRTPARPRR
jgi:protein SCO1/2